MDKKTKDNLKKLLFIASYCETLGFNNSKWEFNNFGSKNYFIGNPIDFALISSFIVDHYNYLGGKNIDISKWNASDDTILLLATTRALNNEETLGETNYVKELLKVKKYLFEDERVSGINTLNMLKVIEKNKDSKNNLYLNYNEKGGGNGAAIRTAPIGIAFSDEKTIIRESFMNSIQTHNQILGYMGGISVALITYFANKEINPYEWFDKLIELEKIIDKKLQEIIEKNSESDYEKYKKNGYTFWNKIKDYNDYRVKKIKKRNYQDTKDRYEYLFKLLRPGNTGKKDVFLGASGLEVVILSYEAILLSCNPETKKINFDSLINYGVLHAGDNDSTGAIVGAWYGAYKKKIPDNIQVKQLEFYEELNKAVDVL
jgi:ADP-ribosylglycohydrolase